MAQYKFTQVNWKSHFIIILPVLLFRELQDHFGTGLAMLFATGTGIFLELLAIKYFTTVADFQDSYLSIKEKPF
ncbi:hypothetical protein [Adhaeribacter pallidiroseus]|uniref:Uncharacterized protein n=1 Tax=Adhaeribacter pallidiroseus TaxID=2072847 RepID=A0A369QLU4_9BACT|nr:hypothetical protein [Adhaeribacter pallidiroseus]RDC64196.1 hypothetical protein AHMF7616_02808 [Adhaeribacter pallidiroseus]